ncbi:MAG: PfkB family carbohydrate kinase [Pseudomonadota bacterium]
MADVVCFGDLLVDFVPTVTGTGLADAPGFTKAAGGAAANVAVGLARLGTSSGFMGKVGDDPFGRFLAGTLAAEGVDTSPLGLDPAHPTAIAFVSLREDGEREFLFYRDTAPDRFMAASDIDDEALRAAKVFHFDSIALAAEPPRTPALAAAEHARGFGAMISFDVNLRQMLWPDIATARSVIDKAATLSSVLKVSDDELEVLTGNRDVETAREAYWHDAMQLLVVSRGSAGCIAVTAETQVDVPSFRVTPVDTTGAGDAFVAGLLSSLASDTDVIRRPDDLARACRVANAAGALTTMTRGAIPGLPTRAAIDRLIAEATPG